MGKMFGVLLLLLQLTLATASKTSKSFPVHRALQFNLGDRSFGSRVSTLELKASSNPGITQPKPSKTKGKKPRRLQPLNRKCIVVTMQEATKELLEHLVDARRVGGLLIVIPEETTVLEAGTLNNWKLLEEWMLSRELKVPIYFTIESEQTNSIVNFVHSPGAAASSDDYLLKTTVKPSKQIKTPTLQNIQGWLAGEAKDVDSEHLPTLAVMGHYDSFGVIPGLAKGGGSSAVAVLELARLFAKAYKKQKGAYNVMFVLTAGGHMNYAGARDWLEQLDVQLMDSIDFVVCLDDLQTTSQLYLHYSKNPNDATMKRITQSLQSETAKTGTIQLIPKRKKISLTQPQLAWQHEQFAMKRIVGVTLSSRAEPSLFANTHDLYRSPTATVKDLSKVITVIANGLANIVYPSRTVTEEVEREEAVDAEEVAAAKKNKKKKKTTKKVNQVTMKVDPKYITTWTNYMRAHARVAPFMSHEHAVAIEKALKSTVRETSIQKFVLEETAVQNFVFYDGVDGTMSAYLVKGIEFDIKMTIGVAVYLGAVWLYMLVLKDGWNGAKRQLLGKRKSL